MHKRVNTAHSSSPMVISLSIRCIDLLVEHLYTDAHAVLVVTWTSTSRFCIQERCYLEYIDLSLFLKIAWIVMVRVHLIR